MGFCLLWRSRWLMAEFAALLNLHRAYFAAALDERPTELSSHRYVPSVLATYRSAWRLGKSLQLVWAKYPDSISRVGLMWSQGLSAAVNSVPHPIPRTS